MTPSGFAPNQGGSATGGTEQNVPSTVVKRDTAGNFSAGSIAANLVGNVTGNADTATSFTGALVGEVTGTQGATVVSGAVSANTSDAIVRRDGAGNFSAGVVTANLAGNVTGNVAGNLTGNVTGNVAGNLTGNVTGNVAGNLTGNVTGDVVGDVAGDLTGNVTGNVAGNLTGNVTGNVAGNLTGNVTGNVAGNLTGNVTGNVAGNLTGNVTGNVAGNLTGNVTGNVTGNADTATSFTGALVGEVTGTQGVTYVAGAVSEDTKGAIVRRDGAGNFSANTITADLLGSATDFTGDLGGEVTGKQGVTYVTGAVSTNDPESIVRRDVNGAFEATTITAANFFGSFFGNVSGSAADFTNALAGDVAGNQGSTSVVSIGGVLAGDVVAGAELSNNATDKNDASGLNALVRRSNGDFSAGSITATLIGNATGFTGALSGDVTGVQGATVISNLDPSKLAPGADGQLLSVSTGVASWTSRSDLETSPTTVCCRLSLSSSDPVTQSDVTGAVLIHFVPYKGNEIALHNGSIWVPRLVPVGGVSIAPPSPGSQNFDIFVYDDNGTPALETVNWDTGNPQARIVALVAQDGVLVKDGDTTRRYVGTGRTTSAGNIDDRLKKRFLWNFYNRVDRKLKVVETANDWDYGGAAYRKWNDTDVNRVEVVIGIAEVTLTLRFAGGAFSATENGGLGIGVDQETVNNADTYTVTGAGGAMGTATADLTHQPSAGYHFYQALEVTSGGGDVTFVGDRGTTFQQSGMVGHVGG